MGRLGDTVGDWARSHKTLCLIISACVLIVGLILIIAGAFLTGLNGGEWSAKNETFNEFNERQRWNLLNSTKIKSRLVARA
ncbi:unnamed protein product [Rodentolepis nana]|uniref:Uncharacterized protein n=1 Tax=Rodentolepis nana TaxID=102285 RepID=A0A0R3TE26_RODNA|nr:unnamed protein product [Rodentolepis nana]